MKSWPYIFWDGIQRLLNGICRRNPGPAYTFVGSAGRGAQHGDGPRITLARWPRLPVSQTTGLLGKIALRVVDVMNKDICCVSAHVEVVVVVTGDGQVPHPAVMDGRGRSADDYSNLAVSGLEMIARFEVICRNSAVVRIRIPE
jgi:hypothetical protein